MELKRIDSYEDARFSKTALFQHGAFVLDGEPYEVEITGENTATVRGRDASRYPAVIEEFRFFAEHITVFYDETNVLIASFPPVLLFSVALERIRPSQFYADEEKLSAVQTFVFSPEDIVIPLLPREDGTYISLDGHTRLALAAARGFSHVKGFLTQAGDYIHEFVLEAEKRGVLTPYDIKIIAHEEYEIKWNRFCDDFWNDRKNENE